MAGAIAGAGTIQLDAAERVRGLALLLAAVGIYGVVAYAVSQRTSEIGIRLALGAEARDIRGMIVGDAASLAAMGLGIGVVLALALSRVATLAPYETSDTDPLTFAAVVAILGPVALAASYIPARRASRIRAGRGVALPMIEHLRPGSPYAVRTFRRAPGFLRSRS